MLKITSPCWTAITRRAENERDAAAFRATAPEGKFENRAETLAALTNCAVEMVAHAKQQVAA